MSKSDACDVTYHSRNFELETSSRKKWVNDDDEMWLNTLSPPRTHAGLGRLGAIKTKSSHLWKCEEPHLQSGIARDCILFHLMGSTLVLHMVNVYEVEISNLTPILSCQQMIIWQWTFLQIGATLEPSLVIFKQKLHTSRCFHGGSYKKYWV